MGMAVNTTLQVMNLGYKAGLPILDNWENFMSSEVRSNVLYILFGYVLQQGIIHLNIHVIVDS